MSLEGSAIGDDRVDLLPVFRQSHVAGPNDGEINGETAFFDHIGDAVKQQIDSLIGSHATHRQDLERTASSVEVDRCPLSEELFYAVQGRHYAVAAAIQAQ